MDKIKNVNNTAAIFFWLGILWLRHKELIPGVREQLETATKEVAQGVEKADLDRYLSLMDSELKKAEDALARHDIRSADPATMALQTNIDNIQQARATLVALKVHFDLFSYVPRVVLSSIIIFICFCSRYSHFI